MSKGSQTLPWVEKYRPKSADDLIGHNDISNTLQKLISAERLPHLLFYGPPGTGKTSTILALAKQMYGDKMSSMVLELNASDDRKIDVVRDRIKNFAGSKQLFQQVSGTKLVILDEADAMIKDAQFALRRVIEKYSKNARFCLICNYVNNIIPALQSRCTRFRFAPLEEEQIVDRLKFVIEEEEVKCTEDGISAILRLSQGDMRKVLNILQATAFAFDEVNCKNVHLCTGTPLQEDIKKIVNVLLNDNYTTSYNTILEITKDQGFALKDVIPDVSKYALQLQLSRVVKIYLTEQLADLEYRLMFVSSEEKQLASLVGMFQIARDMMGKEN
eukprot:TRINITY_DN4969_c0_g1_i1.p1 TRINITY_DN4969_c0_g1~~TRINITY_DN4969_c0_g1_i1.p1  ORF type:complete len:330 (-),score=92.34 TRINITY_DN4969_c0_g1_i1:171-1160(-)